MRKIMWMFYRDKNYVCFSTERFIRNFFHYPQCIRFLILHLIWSPPPIPPSNFPSHLSHSLQLFLERSDSKRFSISPQIGVSIITVKGFQKSSFYSNFLNIFFYDIKNCQEKTFFCIIFFHFYIKMERNPAIK